MHVMVQDSSTHRKSDTIGVVMRFAYSLLVGVSVLYYFRYISPQNVAPNLAYAFLDVKPELLPCLQYLIFLSVLFTFLAVEK